MHYFTQRWKILVAGAVVAVGIGTAAGVSAQQEDERRWGNSEATIYRDANYQGPAVAVSGARPNLGLSWPVNSIRVRSGRWELCERSQYRGQCWTFNGDTPVLGTPIRGRTVQSMRPVGGGGGGGGGNPGTPGPSLRGSFAEFYTAPQQYGQRVRACQRGSATASCAARTADEFCRSVGWGGSAREHQETVNRTVYLADVLCVRSGY